MTNYLTVGKIVNTHGIRGELRVISISDFTEQRYQKGNTLYISCPNSTELIPVVIESHRKHKNFDLVKFQGVNNINDVEKYKGCTLKVSEDQLEELDEHEYYYHEIIGCSVVTEEGETIGTIKEILAPGANDVWVVKRPRKKDAYIPYIEDVVKHVDVKNKIITIHVMEGLLEE